MVNVFASKITIGLTVYVLYALLEQHTIPYLRYAFQFAKLMKFILTVYVFAFQVAIG
jgi:hypothetical protein